MSIRYLRRLPIDRAGGIYRGLPSICSAHPAVIEATLLECRVGETPVLIEATCNQVNQHGGYTGMTPLDFRHFVESIARKVGFDTHRLILGGDHLGPNPWKHMACEDAMARAEEMVDAYVRAGFTKIHLDTSMGCAGESAALSDIVTAARAARLAAVSERAARESDFNSPAYVLGTEVPVPGGAKEEIDHREVTTAHAVIETVDIHRQAFSSLGLDKAFSRAIAIVVQPGVEFGSEDVRQYDRRAAAALSASLGQAMQQFVFEAHSTDYQFPQALKGLVEDGFAILKVGPALTFALRQALYGLDRIAAFLHRLPEEETLLFAMERMMIAQPGHWEKYYCGSDDEQRLQRHFSYSDRIRYYWPHPDSVAAVGRLLKRLAGRRLPETLISQYLGDLYPAVARGVIEPTAEALVSEAIRKVIRIYNHSCGIGGAWAESALGV